MALPSNDKVIGDLGHTDDHNAIVNEISYVKDNYLSASSTFLSNTYLRRDTASVVYATKISPAFTGTPTAPTAASATNTTQIATTAFVRTAVSNLVASAPTTLDTLNELAAALGNDPNFATTVTNSLAAKLDSATASSIYLTQSNAAATYFPRSASGGLLTEAEAAALYFPLSSSGGLLTELEASSLYLPISASATLSPIGYLTASAAALTYLRQDTASSTYLTISSSVNFGSSTVVMSTTEPPNPKDGTLWVDTDSDVPIFSASVDLSEYLTIAAASALYVTKDEIIDGGSP